MLKNLFLLTALLLNIFARGYVFDNGLIFEEKTIFTEYGRAKAYVLTVDPKYPELSIKPALSFNQVFGFETLEEMAKRNHALAAINGGFFHAYGQPIGQVVLDGQWITLPTGDDPVFFIDSSRRPHLEPVKARIFVEVGGRKYYLNGLNRFGSSGEAILYTSMYGTSTRQKFWGTNLIIREGKVEDIEDEPFALIPPESSVLYLGKDSAIKESIVGKISRGSDIRTGFDILTPPVYWSEIKNAMEAGPYLVRDGKIVVKKWEPRIGLSTIPMARSAVGITRDEKVMLITVEGTEPGSGISLRGLARVLLDMGVKQAATLDGGASATMYFDGRVVNRPSGGKQRPLGGGIMITSKLFGDM